MNLSRILIIFVVVLCGGVFATGQTGSGSGNGNGSGIGNGDPSVVSPSLPRVITPYKILKQPKAKYTRAARNAGFEGGVLLKITLLSSGQIGSVTFVPKQYALEVEKYGLVDSAIKAARKIKFTPKMVNGVPQSVIVFREYAFRFY